MRRLVIGCAAIAVVALTPRSEARPNGSLGFAKYLAAGAHRAFSKIGVASWYGEDFQGAPTASGEAYDMNQLTAANRDLPLGTRIKVTNLENNRELILRVNDRGPFVPGRFLDVSRAAASQLGFKGAGLAKVQVQVLRYPKGYRPNQDYSSPTTSADRN